MAVVLIVDDSRSERVVLKSILEKHGYQILTAETGADGVAICREEQPDAVLMDIIMPGLNGFQATRQLTNDPKTDQIPVVIITTRDQEADKEWGFRQGARSCLTKPVKEDVLLKTLKNLIKTRAA